MAVIRLQRPFDSLTTPRPLVAFRDAVLGALEVRYLPGRISWTVLAAFLVAEGLLLGRLWVQLSGGSVSEGFFGQLYRWSAPLVEPFRGYESTVPIRDTGIFEFATLAAMEAYLIATLVVIVVLLVVPRVLTFFLALLLGRCKLGEKNPRIVRTIDAVRMIEAHNAELQAYRAPGKPERHGAAVQFRTRPTRGHYTGSQRRLR